MKSLSDEDCHVVADLTHTDTNLYTNFKIRDDQDSNGTCPGKSLNFLSGILNLVEVIIM